MATGGPELTDPTFTYWAKEWLTILLADVAAAGIGFLLLEGRITRTIERQRQVRLGLQTIATLASIHAEGHSWVLKYQLTQGWDKKRAYRAPFLGLEAMVRNPSHWDFDGASALKTAAESLFSELDKWESYRVQENSNINGGNRTVEHLDNALTSLDATLSVIRLRPVVPLSVALFQTMKRVMRWIWKRVRKDAANKP